MEATGHPSVPLVPLTLGGSVQIIRRCARDGWNKSLWLESIFYNFIILQVFPRTAGVLTGFRFCGPPGIIGLLPALLGLNF